MPEEQINENQTNLTPSYWLVGAYWDGDERREDFYEGGFWRMGYQDSKQPVFAERRNAMRPGDRIAIKRMNGQGANDITIQAIGIIKHLDEQYVFVDWIVRDLERRVPSRGCLKTIHGPYKLENKSDSEWIQQIFCL